MATLKPEKTDEQALPATFCVMPFVNVHTATDGTISPCCEFQGSTGNLANMTVLDAWKGDELKAVRSAFEAGRPPSACDKCLKREALEGDSLRIQSNRRHEKWLNQFATTEDATTIAPVAPVSYDLRFSNLCNFKCRSCWHGASSKWFSDGKAIGVTVGDRAEISSFASVDDFLNQVGPSLDAVEFIYFAGGEPLMMPEHYALLESLITLGRTEVRIAYNSNMSRLALRGKSVLDLWSHFPNIDLGASVDGTGELGAMMRSGFSWDTFVKNVSEVRRVTPHVRINFRITVSIFNIHALPELMDALHEECAASADTILLQSLQDPSHYRTQVLPRSLKKEVAADLQSYCSFLPEAFNCSVDEASDLTRQVCGAIDFMNGQDRSVQLEQFKSVSQKLDELRAEKTTQLLPHLEPHLHARRLKFLRKAATFLKKLQHATTSS
ncbi:MAG: twitch domain-containing radical SAM protein [Pseudomonadota bacterium]